jgi:hypothetical protein
MYEIDIDEGVPLPRSATEALPSLTPAEELEMRARTIKLLADLAGTTLEAGEDHEDQAADLARQMMQDPKLRPEFATYPNETIAYLAGMVAQSKVQLVDELSELKMYVVNKLLLEVESAKTSRDRISALKILGEVDGINAFKRITEVTHVIKPIEEVEAELLKTLEVLQLTAIDAEYEEVKTGVVE